MFYVYKSAPGNSECVYVCVNVHVLTFGQPRGTGLDPEGRAERNLCLSSSSLPLSSSSSGNATKHTHTHTPIEHVVATVNKTQYVCTVYTQTLVSGWIKKSCLWDSLFET